MQNPDWILALATAGAIVTIAYVIGRLDGMFERPKTSVEDRELMVMTVRGTLGALAARGVIVIGEDGVLQRVAPPMTSVDVISVPARPDGQFDIVSAAAVVEAMEGRAS